ncbi:MAG: M48 family metalloprotease [Acidobacteria bacterium]|nr:M48 family metalloprotease [Acidobacteriota bacterium]
MTASAVAGPPVVEQTRDPKNDKENVEKIGERDVDGKVNFYSIQKEIALGKQMAMEVERTSKIIDDPVISEYVNRVGQNIVRNSDAQVPFTIKVVDSEEVNAFALPGGFFFVNSGLIKLAESESELAGVMAHEIAHVTARHGTRQATKGQIANLASIPMAIFLPGGWLGYGIYQAANLAIPMTFLKFSRNYEKEADFLGLQYLYASGYDPTSMVTFFERIQAQQKRKPGAVAKVFSSHPPTEKRIEDIQKEMGTILPAKPEYLVTTNEFQDVRQRLIKMTNRTKRDDEDPNRPTLRRSPSDKIDPAESGGDQGSEEDDRPTLKRRQLSDED